MRLFVSLFVAIWFAGCSSWALPEAPPRSTPVAPTFNAERMKNHIRFFNDDERHGRGTGTHGFATAAQYAAVQMREARLQPASGTDYRLPYIVSINDVQGAALGFIDPDTVLFRPGIDYVADGRSDSGRSIITELVLQQDSVIGQPGRRGAALVIPTTIARDDLLIGARTAGYAAVFIMGAPDGRVYPKALSGLLVFRVSPDALGSALNRTPDSIGRLFRPGRITRLPIVHPMVARVIVGAQPGATAMNVTGYVAGKHPALASEAILVCADLDGPGRFMDADLTDPNRLGTGASGLLELAHQYAYFSRFTNIPDRTIVFALWSGALSGHSGLRAYLERPLWPIEKTTAILYLGLDPDDEPAVRAMTDRAGIRLISVLQEVDPTATAMYDDLLDHSNAWAGAGLEALRLATAGHDLLMPEVVTPRLPVASSPTQPPPPPSY